MGLLLTKRLEWTGMNEMQWEAGDSRSMDDEMVDASDGDVGGDA
jgi:hypothetical protein